MTSGSIIDQAAMALVEQDFARLQGDMNGFVDDLYDRLFVVAPDTRQMFADDMRRQKEKMSSTLLLILASCDDIPTLDAELRRLGRLHREIGAEKVHFEVLKDVLLWTIEKHVGPDFNADHRAAWATLYDRLTDAMMATA